MFSSLVISDVGGELSDRLCSMKMTSSHVHQCDYILRSCSQFVHDSHAASCVRRASATVSGAARPQIKDVTIHYMHHGPNTALPLPCTPLCPHIDGYGLQHVITVMRSLWGDPLQSCLRDEGCREKKCFVSPRGGWESRSTSSGSSHSSRLPL